MNTDTFNFSQLQKFLCKQNLFSQNSNVVRMDVCIMSLISCQFSLSFKNYSLMSKIQIHVDLPQWLYYGVDKHEFKLTFRKRLSLYWRHLTGDI